MDCTGERSSAGPGRAVPRHQGRGARGRDGRDRAPDLHHGRRGAGSSRPRSPRCRRPSTPSAAPAARTRCCCRSRRSTSSRATRSSPTPFTFFATAGTIHNVGATPVFVDIEPATFNISPGRRRGARSRRGPGPSSRSTCSARWRAMEELSPIAARHGHRAHRGRGPVHRRAPQDRRRLAHGRRARARRHASASSRRKNLGGYGDGGMMVTQDDALADAARAGCACTAARKQYFHDEVGFNSRLDALQAAVLLAKLPHLARLERQARARTRRTTPRRSRVIRTSARRAPIRRTSRSSTSTPSGCRPARRAAGPPQGAAASATSIYYPLPLHLQPCFAYLGYQAGQLPGVARRAADAVFSLPIYPELTHAQQDEVIEARASILRP